jgi:hypothetical protein
MNRRLMVLSAGLLLLGACAKAERAEDAMAETAAAMSAETPAAAVADAGVEKAVAVYRGIQANQAAADSVLAANGLTSEALDSLMYEIASDSARAAAYSNAIR